MFLAAMPASLRPAFNPTRGSVVDAVAPFSCAWPTAANSAPTAHAHMNFVHILITCAP